MARGTQRAKPAMPALLPDHAAFVAAHPTSLRREDGDAFPAWRAPGKAPRVVDENAAWTSDVIEVYGGKQVAKLRAGRGLGFWDRALLRHAVPIASCGTGDVIVQVVDGRSKGHVLLVDHDAYGELLAQLARLGKEPTSDQVVAVLVHRRFAAAERIARSFSDFYQQLYRARAGLVAQDAGGYQVRAFDGALSAIAGDRKQLYLLGARGRRGGVLRVMRPRGAPEIVVDEAGTADAQLFVHRTRLLKASWQDLRVLQRGGFRTVMRGKFILGSDGARGMWAIHCRRKRYAFYHSKDGARFVHVEDYDFDSILTAHAACARGLLLSSLQDARLFVVDRKGELAELETPEDDYFGVLPIFVTRRGTLLAGDEWRSTDVGKTWKRTASAGGVSAAMLLETSTGVIVALGTTEREDTRLLISRDDGKRFTKLDVRIPGKSTGIAELGGMLVIANGARLVQVALP